MDTTDIARVAYEANRVLCEVEGITTGLPWSHASAETKDAVVRGVLRVYENPSMTPEDSHEAWYHDMLDHGWVYGTHKDPVAKTHPNLVPFADLPAVAKVKNLLFVNVVLALAPYEHMQRTMREQAAEQDRRMQEQQQSLDFERQQQSNLDQKLVDLGEAQKFDPSAEAGGEQKFDPSADISVDPARVATTENNDGQGTEQSARQSEGASAQADRDGGEAAREPDAEPDKSKKKR